MYGNPQDTPVYRQWLSHMVDFEGQLPHCWDEEELVGHVRQMLAAASQLFAFLPEPVHKLKEAHEAAEIGGVEYIRYALSFKLKEASRVLNIAKPISYYEKLGRNLQRGFERRNDRLRNFNLMDRQAQADQILAKGENNITFQEEAELIDFLELLARTEKIFEEVADMTSQEEELTSIITIIRSLEELRPKLTARLAELGGPINIEGNTGSSSNTLGLSAADFAISERKEVDESPAKPGKKRKGKDKNPPEPLKQDTPPSTEEFDAAKISLAKVRKAIELAEACGKLRVIVPHREAVRQNFEAKWNQLFEKLGYTGDVEFLNFDELGRSKNGTEIPLVMVKSINTHRNLWDKKRYRNIFVLDIKTLKAITAIL